MCPTKVYSGRNLFIILTFIFTSPATSSITNYKFIPHYLNIRLKLQQNKQCVTFQTISMAHPNPGRTPRDNFSNVQDTFASVFLTSPTLLWRNAGREGGGGDPFEKWSSQDEVATVRVQKQGAQFYD